MNKYEKQAQDFLNSTNTEFSIEYLRHDKYFDGDKEKRDIYGFTFRRGSRQYSAEFGQSIFYSQNKKKATAYDVLACLQKYDVGTLEDFCRDFCYETDSRRAEKIYNAVLDEYKNVCMLWNEDEVELLKEIQ